MELRCCGQLHCIQAIKGGLVTKVPNVARGQPKLKFKKFTDIYDDLLSHNDDGIVERSCSDLIEESTMKTMPDASVCNVNDGDDQRINNLDDDDFDNFTLTQIRESCKTRKRKHSQCLDSSERNIKIEDFSFPEDYGKEQMVVDDSDFMETLSSWKSKISKNTKAKKKRCFKDAISTNTLEIMLVVKSEEILISHELPPSTEDIQNGQEFPPSSGEIQDGQVCSPSSEEIQDGQEFPPSSEVIVTDQEIPSSSGYSSALIEVKSEVPETDCFGEQDNYSIIESQEAEIIYEWNLENELNNVWQERVELIPLQMVRPSSMDIVISSNTGLSNDQSPFMPAIEFESEECIIHPDLHYISPQVLALVEGRSSDIYDSQPGGDTDTAVSLSNEPTKDLEYIDVELKDDNTFLGDCNNDEFTTGSEDPVKPSSTTEDGPNSDEFTTDSENQVEPSSTIEHGPISDGCLVRCSDDIPDYEKQSFASVNIDEKRHISEATDELTSWDEFNGSSKLHRPERLPSTRKAISPSSQERLCKARQSVDLNHKNKLKWKGKLCFSEQTDKMNGTAEETLDDVTGARFTDIPNKISVIPRTSKRVSHPKGISKIPHTSRQASRIGCSTVQSCSKSAIAFTQQQMHDVESLAMKLTRELNSMKDIVDDMLRSEFCLNTSLRHKVNEARMAVKNATRAEEAAKRCLAFMSRDCSRFCKIMKLADDGPPPQDVVPQVVRKERKKIAFADEAGGKLCQFMFYEDDGVSLSESN
ncbi:uncharacterized protein LOC109797308 [Cajanus cajan]|uniref:Uncharacterized protein n=1 Tax=Cajanus cajan TaxID=3821 RepID=A0A151UBR3_CAJCA|nr:uncharacterized protein LOC109797308 [Cajanus cajan]KYP76767.1 hypothetical protein KK1_021021 [Cajanus cajan]